MSQRWQSPGGCTKFALSQESYKIARSQRLQGPRGILVLEGQSSPTNLGVASRKVGHRPRSPPSHTRQQHPPPQGPRPQPAALAGCGSQAASPAAPCAPARSAQRSRGAHLARTQTVAPASPVTALVLLSLPWHRLRRCAAGAQRRVMPRSAQLPLWRGARGVRGVQGPPLVERCRWRWAAPQLSGTGLRITDRCGGQGVR